VRVPPAPLSENAGLAFRGEPAWAPAQLTDRPAKQLLAAANACGRPNSDVLRRRLAVVDGVPVESWAIDFPAHFTSQECALYEQPFARLANAGTNPHANPDLRRALARLSRYLAMPAEADVPDWIWVEDELLPDASLVAVAREDDFAHGVLSSAAFAAWYAAHRPAAPSADRVVASFPFPWPPATTLNALTAAQEESRHAIARAIRAGNAEQLSEATARAYGWAADLPEDELLRSLTKLHALRAQSPDGSSS
jgi:hypothetical protein